MYVYALTLSHTRTDLRSSSSDYFIQENQPTCRTSWLHMIIPCRQSHKLALLWERITLNWMDSVPWPTMSGRHSIHDCFVLSGGVVGGALGGWRVLFSEFHMAHLDLLCGTLVCHKANQGVPYENLKIAPRTTCHVSIACRSLSATVHCSFNRELSSPIEVLIYGFVCMGLSYEANSSNK